MKSDCTITHDTCHHSQSIASHNSHSLLFFFFFVGCSSSASSSFLFFFFSFFSFFSLFFLCFSVSMSLSSSLPPFILSSSDESALSISTCCATLFITSTFFSGTVPSLMNTIRSSTCFRNACPYALVGLSEKQSIRVHIDALLANTRPIFPLSFPVIAWIAHEL